MTLVPNPFYYGPAPKLRRVIFRMLPNTRSVEIALRTGEIDFWPGAAKTSAGTLMTNPRISAIVSAGAHPQFLVLNPLNAPLGDRAVRLALRSGLDRTSIAQKTYPGGAVVDDSPLAIEDPEHVDVMPDRFDPVRARDILDAAGWHLGADGVRVKNGIQLRFRMAGVANIPAVEQIVEVIRDDRRRIGVELDARTYPPSLLFDADPKRGILSGRRFDVALYGVERLRAGDLGPLFSCATSAPPGTNLSGLCDSQLDTLFRRYDATVDEKHALLLAREAQRRLIDLVPAIVLVKRNEYYLMRDDVFGFVLHPFSPVAGTILKMDVTH